MGVFFGQQIQTTLYFGNKPQRLFFLDSLVIMTMHKIWVPNKVVILDGSNEHYTWHDKSPYRLKVYKCGIWSALDVYSTKNQTLHVV